MPPEHGPAHAIDARAGARGHAALAAILCCLRCPHCRQALALAGTTLRCSDGHSYDVARQGHVTLLAARVALPPGDSREMVAARQAFLSRGRFTPIARAVAQAAGECGGLRHAARRLIVEVGAGTGYYLAAVLRELAGPHGLAIDSSRPALRQALRADPRIAAVACDVWHELPLRDSSADVVLDVFAPRNPPEIARILRSGGCLVVVTPTPRHLQELVEAVGMLTVDADKESRLAAALAPHFDVVRRVEVEFVMELDRDDTRALVAMGPTAHHLSSTTIAARLEGAPARRATTASVRVETFRRA